MTHSSIAQKPTRAQLFLLFSFFFLVIAAFWTIKPLRTSSAFKAVGTYYPLVKQGPVLIVPLVMLFYYQVARLINPRSLIILFSGVFFLASFGFWTWFKTAPSTLAKVSFYFYVDTFITVMVALFWTYANSILKSTDAKKYFGPIATGGILGGIVGSKAAGTLTERLGDDIILLSMVFVAAIAAVMQALHTLSTDPEKYKPMIHGPRKIPDENSASFIDGLKLLHSSKYLMSIAMIVGSYEVISTVIDYQFNASASGMFPDRKSMGAYIGNVFFYAQLAALAIGIFVTPYVNTRYGVFHGLLFLPSTLLLGSVLFFLFPILPIITFTIGSEAAFAYSINQASKETLYVPLSQKLKVKGKAAVDMVVFRFAKGLGGVLTWGMVTLTQSTGVSNRALMIFNFVLLLPWIRALRYVAKEFEAISDGKAAKIAKSATKTRKKVKKVAAKRKKEKAS